MPDIKLPIGTYSFYNQLQQCPHKAYHVYVGRTLPYVETPEMAWGNKVHKAMENRIKYAVPLPEEMAAAEPSAAVFHDYSTKIVVRCEWQLAMDINGQPCDYNDYSKVWFRGKLDCVTLDSALTFAWEVDWKTGNVREDPFELETGALLLKVHHTNLETIKGEYFWMKTGQNGLRYTFNKHGETYQKLVNLRAEAESYFRAGVWPKRKSPLCNWCAVKSCENYTGKNVK